MPVQNLFKPRFVIGLIVILVIAALMYAGVINSDAGLGIIVAILAGLGVYNRVR